jgi:amino acid transporter
MFDMSIAVRSEVIVGAIIVVFTIVAIGLAVVKYYEKRYREQK